MKLFHNKKVVDAYVLDEHLRPAELPSPGLGLEKFQPLQYTANTPQKLEDFITAVQKSSPVCWRAQTNTRIRRLQIPL